MPTEKINIRGVFFDNVTLDEATEILRSRLAAAKPDGDTFPVYTPNPEIVQLCIEHSEYYKIVNSAGLIVADGIGIIKASNILGTPLKERVPGVELGEKALEIAAECGYKVYFLGGKPGIAEQASEMMKEKYPGLKIVGTSNGYFRKVGAENQAIIEKINLAAPDILFVCLGAPTQERWIYENRTKLSTAKICLALGGSLDVYSGNVKRAPLLFRKLQLEWFYRLLVEPKRLGRMMKLPKFILGTYKCRREN